MNNLNATEVRKENDNHYLLPDGTRATFKSGDTTYEYDPTGVRGANLLNFDEGIDETTQTNSDKVWVDNCSPTAILAQKWVEVRSKRDMLLRECDWWGISDNTMSDAQTAYRKALRDLPASESNPDNIVFPSKP